VAKNQEDDLNGISCHMLCHAHRILNALGDLAIMEGTLGKCHPFQRHAGDHLMQGSTRLISGTTLLAW
jgi:hypothetical protein